MAEEEALERDARGAAEDPPGGEAVALEARGAKIGGEDERALLGGDELVDEIRVRGDRAVAGKGPRRRGPDHREDRRIRALGVERLRDGVRSGGGERDVDRARGLVLV